MSQPCSFFEPFVIGAFVGFLLTGLGGYVRRRFFIGRRP